MPKYSKKGLGNRSEIEFQQEEQNAELLLKNNKFLFNHSDIEEVNIGLKTKNYCVIQPFEFCVYVLTTKNSSVNLPQKLGKLDIIKHSWEIELQ